MASETDPLGYPEVGGGYEQTLEVTVGSLENAGNEPWVPGDETGLNSVDEVEVLGQTDSGYNITWNFAQTQFDVVDMTDGSDAPATTDIGSFRVRVSGTR